MLRDPKGHLVEAIRLLRTALRTSLRSSSMGANSDFASNHSGARSLSSFTNDFLCCMLLAWLFNVCKRNQAETGKPSVEASGGVNPVPGSAYVRQAWQIKLPVGRIPNHDCPSGRRQPDVFCQHSSLRRTRNRAPSCLKQPCAFAALRGGSVFPMAPKANGLYTLQLSLVAHIATRKLTITTID